MKSFKIAAFSFLLPLLAAPSALAVTVLTFEGLGNAASIGNFYNGGAGGNLGITFSSNAQALIDADAGGTGNFGGEPSPSTILFFQIGFGATMNVAGGFEGGFSLFYSSINTSGSVSIYDALNGTGALLATINLPVTPTSGAPDPTGQYSPFFQVGTTFAGTARSVVFVGAENQIAFDDITLGSTNPGGNRVPDSASALPLLGAALGALALLRRKLA